MADLGVRPAVEADLPAVRAVYNHYVAHSTCTFQLDPDTDADRRRWFRDRSPAHPVIVAELAGEVVGWAALSGWNPRAAYARTAEVSVYVRHDCHRRGVGRALVADLVGRATALGHHTLVGAVCTEHPASLGLLEGFGFRPTGTLQELGWKFGRWLDVAYLQLLLPDAGADA